MTEKIVVEKAWNIRVFYGDECQSVDISDLRDYQLNELYNDTATMNEFPSLMEAVQTEIEQRAVRERIRADSEWVAKQIFDLMAKRPHVVISDVKAAIDRLAGPEQRHRRLGRNVPGVA